jgi:hypothetical protein
MSFLSFFVLLFTNKFYRFDICHVARPLNTSHTDIGNGPDLIELSDNDDNESDSLSEPLIKFVKG